MNRLVLLRHGRTEGTERHLYYGATDLPPKTPNAEHSIHSCIPALFVKQTYSITIQTYVVPSAIVYSRMLLAG